MTYFDCCYIMEPLDDAIKRAAEYAPNATRLCLAQAMPNADDARISFDITSDNGEAVAQRYFNARSHDAVNLQRLHYHWSTPFYRRRCRCAHRSARMR